MGKLIDEKMMDRASRTFSYKYMMALVLLGLFAIFEHIIFYNEVNANKRDSEIINISGRQRMLGQKVVKITYSFKSQKLQKKLDSKFVENKNELRRVISELKKSHLIIQKYLRQNYQKDKEIFSAFLEMEKHLVRMLSSSGILLQTNSMKDLKENALGAIRVIRETDKAFLNSMDEVVSIFEEKNKSKIYHLSMTIKSMLFLILMVLMMEAFFIFRPAVKDLERYEDELINKRKIAESTVKTKARFLATMSHEIRTPLNGILGCSNLLLDRVRDEKNIELLETVVASGDTLLTLINDILDFSKLESGKMELENEAFDLKLSVEQVSQLFSSKTSEGSVTLVNEFDVKVPQWIYGDVTRIRQILSNLVSNAVKFTDQGRVEVKTSLIKADENGHKIQFSVSDDGIGMSEQDIHKLFKSFSQVDASTTKKFGGTGLGLAICKELVELMEGEIWVESKKGEGSTFFFTIKAKEFQGEKISEKTEPIVNGPNANLANEYPLQILLADDNRVNQFVGKKLIGKLGHKVDIAANGKEVIQMMQEKAYDLIFMDCHMPEMDGFEATERILKDFPESPPMIVALTASAMKEDRDKCFLVGMNDFITKPIDIKEVIRVIKLREIDHGHYPIKRTSVKLDEVAIYEQFDHNKKMILEASKEFVYDVDEYLIDIEISIKERDAEKLEKSAHSLKRIASSFHAKDVVEISFKLEMLGHKESLEGADELFKHLEKVTKKLKDDLRYIFLGHAA